MKNRDYGIHNQTPSDRSLLAAFSGVCVDLYSKDIDYKYSRLHNFNDMLFF